MLEIGLLKWQSRVQSSHSRRTAGTRKRGGAAEKLHADEGKMTGAGRRDQGAETRPEAERRPGEIDRR